ncbi:MAG: protein kinase [Burkholderiales bacterium]|nr:protein kinase [Burkholderiales bacterium]
MTRRTRVVAEDKASFPPVRKLGLGGVGYQLDHQIGVGAFSKVYGGVDMWGNPIAMKLMSPDASRSLWEREGKALVRFRHPCVPHLYGAHEHEGRLYLVLERCGIAVSRMRPSAPLRPRACLVVARSLLQVLHTLHVMKHWHGDVSANNVLVRDPSPQSLGIVKLTDFALCQPVGQLSEGRHLVPPWQPLPERLEPGRPGNLGPATDVYLAAMVLLQVLTGETKHYTSEETMAGAPRERALATGTRLGEAIAAGLALDAAARPSAAALWSMLAMLVNPRLRELPAGAAQPVRAP